MNLLALAATPDLSAQEIMGGVLVVIGLLLLIASFRHERLRHRILREVPQAAPKRVAPELHALAALITAGGVMMLAGWLAGLAGLLLRPSGIKPEFAAGTLAVDRKNGWLAQALRRRRQRRPKPAMASRAREGSGTTVNVAS